MDTRANGDDVASGSVEGTNEGRFRLSFRRRTDRGPATAGTYAAGRAGLRRVDWVNLFIDTDDRRMRAEVSGVGFRLPVVCPVPLSVAADLIRAGTPCVTSRWNGGR